MMCQLLEEGIAGHIKIVVEGGSHTLHFYHQSGGRNRSAESFVNGVLMSKSIVMSGGKAEVRANCLSNGILTACIRGCSLPVALGMSKKGC